jgi:hypothetical protein
MRLHGATYNSSPYGEYIFLHRTASADRELAARRLCEIILGLAEEFAEAKRTSSLQRPN